MLARTFSRKLDFVGFTPQDRLLVDPGVRLRIRIRKSDQYNWCWAAVAVGVAAAYQDSRPRWSSQCIVATRMKGTECCPAGDFGACDEPHDLTQALEDHYEGEAANKNFEFVKQQIDDGSPIAVRIRFSDSRSGHYVVISGYSVDSGVNHVWVCDPATGLEDHHPIKRFRTDFDKRGTWHRTFLTKGSEVRGISKVPFR